MTTLIEIDQEAIRKEYENMSYNEMSKRLAESYKELSEILGNRASLVSNMSTSSSSSYDSTLTEEDESVKLSKSFLKSVSTGNVDKVSEFLNHPLIDINAKDEEGTTALIYAACFGKYEIVELLLSNGAHIDSQDLHGWTALMWATTNNHEKIVKLLVDHGASSETKSSKGRTVFDFVQKSNNESSHKIADIFATNPRYSICSMRPQLSTSGSLADYKLNTESFLSIDNECKPKLIEEFLMHREDESEDESEDEFDYGDDKDIEFNWDRCMPDQMFVFSADDLPYILDTVITELTLPIRHAQDIFMPANVIFLSARFAHYFSSSELVESVMKGALKRMSAVIKANTQNVHILSYWMTNMTRVLYYLKKDAELVVASAEYQLELSELISETYNFIVSDICKRISQILEPAMLEYDPIEGMEDVNYVDDWQRFFRRSASGMRRNSSSSSEQLTRVISPKTITQLFSSTFYVFQSYEVHSTVIIQALAQFFHFLSCELFNRMLSNKRYLSRSKAVQVRMNLSVLEEWIHGHHLPPSLISYLKPSIQLTQLLQCLSQLDTVESFESTISLFDAINPLQIRRCVLNYRYETQESRLPDPIEKLIHQTVDETIRFRRASTEKRKSIQLRRSLSGCSTESVSQIMGTIFYQHPLEHQEEAENDFDKGEINETKDARFMLPFFVPTTAQLTHAGGWSQKDRISLIPIIPEDWMNKLDKSEN